MPDPIDWGFALPYYLAALGVGYILGSFPTGVVLARMFGLGDLRQIGSGGIGATNALRTGSYAAAIGTLAGDFAKAAGATALGAYFGPQTAILAAAGALLGHLFPVWLGFRGGKGIAVYIGVLAILCYPLALLFCAIWLVVAALFRYSSLALLCASAAMPVAAIYAEAYPIRDLSLLFLLLIFWAHRENIVRLSRGQENKIGQRAK